MSSSETRLSVSLAEPIANKGHEIIRIKTAVDDCLDISLQRTIKVPDNGQSYDLPPDCGAFPIYAVDQYKSKLPATMLAKGGVFIPIYEREAMWINFKARHRPFAVKVYVGGVNAINGERSPETLETLLNRKVKLAEGYSVQDYLVAGSHKSAQQWLDGICTAEGKVMQFVSTPTGTGHSVEAQIRGLDVFAGLQLEIVPAERYKMHVCVLVYKPTYKRIRVFGLNPNVKIRTIQNKVWEVEGFPDKEIPMSRQSVRFEGTRLDPGRTLADYEIEDGDALDFYEAQMGGGPFEEPDEKQRLHEEETERIAAMKDLENEGLSEMAIAPGGFIRQKVAKDKISPEQWNTGNSIIMNLQLVNAAKFQRITGFASTYADHKLPFYQLYNEPPTDVYGNFQGVHSVANIETKTQGKKRRRDDDKDLKFPTVTLQTSDKGRAFRPVSEMEDELE